MKLKTTILPAYSRCKVVGAPWLVLRGQGDTDRQGTLVEPPMSAGRLPVALCVLVRGWRAREFHKTTVLPKRFMASGSATSFPKSII